MLTEVLFWLPTVRTVTCWGGALGAGGEERCQQVAWSRWWGITGHHTVHIHTHTRTHTQDKRGGCRFRSSLEEDFHERAGRPDTSIFNMSLDFNKASLRSTGLLQTSEEAVSDSFSLSGYDCSFG